MKLLLAYYGNPCLRKKAAPIAEINGEIKQLVRDMIETMEEHNGIGLAAPQVKQSLRLFITCAPVKGKDEKWEKGQLRVFINPTIISRSEEETVYSEGCLSIPKVYGDVSRPLRVVIRATGLDGKEFTEEFCGLEAHVVLHENDHINGVLFIDRIHGKERTALEPLLRDVKKKYSTKQ